MFECKPFQDLEALRAAPHVINNTIELDCTPAELFAIFDDEHTWKEWVPGIATVDWTTPRPFGVGTTRTVTFQGGGMKVYEEFIAWDLGKHMAFTFTGATQRVWWAFGEEYRVSDLGGGRCKLAWTVAYEPRFVFKALHFLFGPLMSWGLGRVLKGLGPYVLKWKSQSATVA
jgi:hypothetical protein